MIDPEVALQLTCRLLGLWGTVNALQWWVDRHAWRIGGPLGMDLLSLTRSRLFAPHGPVGRLAAISLRLPLALQFAAALILLAAPVQGLRPLVLVALLASTWLLGLRARIDGADKMALVVTLGTLLQSTAHPALVLAGQWWIAGQLVLAYVTSGAAKLRLACWRDGSATIGALSSYGAGQRHVAAMLRRRGAAPLISWWLMLAECAFPLALLAPLPALLVVLGLFLLFHLATALVMGLNTYPWAFAAAYPSVVLAGGQLQAWMAGA